MTDEMKCPKCGKPLFIRLDPILVPNGRPDLQFECNSVLFASAGLSQSDKCRISELTQTVARLEKEKASLFDDFHRCEMCVRRFEKACIKAEKERDEAVGLIRRLTHQRDDSAGYKISCEAEEWLARHDRKEKDDAD